MLRHAAEVLVRGQQGQTMADAEPGDESVDRPGLHAPASAQVPERGCLDVVFQVGAEKRQGAKAREDLISRAGPAESLEDLLEDESRRDDEFAPFEGVRERGNFGNIGGLIAPHRKRPDARVDEEFHDRERSVL